MILGHVDHVVGAYVHGEMPAGDRARVERHLARCPRCRDLVKRMRAAHEDLPGIPTRPAPDSLWARIELALDARAPLPPERLQPWQLRRLGWSAGAIMAAAVGLFVYVTVQNQRKPYWGVTRLQGRPHIGWFPVEGSARLRVGDQLITDRSSAAEIKVADIGTVKIDPDSIVRLKSTSKTEHKLELEKGALEAKVTAPPRLFIVDTQSARAVDLGCAYRLETANSGTTQLHVTHGEVALEDRGKASLVLQGFSCESRRGAGLGTPIKDDAPVALRTAVNGFDFENGGDASVEAARAAARPQDAITLWHLLGKSSGEERGRLYDTLSRFSRPPETINRAGVIQGDAKMLELWKQVIRYDYGETVISK